jgi:hypothetical protein
MNLTFIFPGTGDTFRGPDFIFSFILKKMGSCSQSDALQQFRDLSNQSDDTENPTWQQGQRVFGGEKEKKITPTISMYPEA